MFVTINNVGILINADVNVNNCLSKKYVRKDLFVTLTTVSKNVINHVTLKNIQVRKIVILEIG